jgi:hypothetical protein
MGARWTVAQMTCLYCNKRLGLLKSFRGESYCSQEHKDLHLNAEASAALERLSSALDEAPARRPRSAQMRARPDWALDLPEPPAPEPAPEPKLDQKIAEVEAVIQSAAEARTEVQAEAKAEIREVREVKIDAKEAAAPLELATLAQAVETSVGVDLPNAPFLADAPTPQYLSESQLTSGDAEPVMVSSSVQYPISATRSANLNVPASSSLVLDVPPPQAHAPADKAPTGGQPTWLPVPQGYPPVVVSSLATMVLDTAGAELIPLQMGEPAKGNGQALAPQTEVIETHFIPPLLPTRTPGLRPKPPVSLQLDRPPRATALEMAWVPRIGSGYAQPALADVLSAEETTVRQEIAIALAAKGIEKLPSFPLLALAFDGAFSRTQYAAELVPQLSATVTPRREIALEHRRPKPGTLPILTALSEQALESPSPVKAEESFTQPASAWQTADVESILPRPRAIERNTTQLSGAANLVSIRWSAAPSLPPTIETGAPVPSTVPFLLFAKPLSLNKGALPVDSGTLPVKTKACRLPAAMSQQEWALTAAYLHPSLPSPLSLVTWSRALAVSIPACKPSNLTKPAPVEARADRGRVASLRPWPESRRGQRLTPLLPPPHVTAWMPVAPVEATVQPPVIEAIRPGPGGTAAPRLNAIRMAPESMPALPLAVWPLTIAPGTGFESFEPILNGTFELHVMNVAPDASPAVWELRSDPETVLPAIAAERNVPMIAASGSYKLSSAAMAPTNPTGRVETFEAVKRLSWSVTTRPPAHGPEPSLFALGRSLS